MWHKRLLGIEKSWYQCCHGSLREGFTKEHPNEDCGKYDEKNLAIPGVYTGSLRNTPMKFVASMTATDFDVNQTCATQKAFNHENLKSLFFSSNHKNWFSKILNSHYVDP